VRRVIRYLLNDELIEVEGRRVRIPDPVRLRAYAAD